MKQKLLSRKNYSPACAYCLFGKLSADEQSVLCMKRGVMMPDSSCKKYEYDPLKRRPQKNPKLEQHDEEEFSL